MSRKYAMSVWCAGAAAMAVVGLAACSSESASASPGADSPFGQCLSEHGVPAPPLGRPGGPGGPEGERPAGPPPGDAGGAPPAPPNIDQGTWDAAMDACRSLAPTPLPR